MDKASSATLSNKGIIAALTREHGGWEQACLRTSDKRSRVKCLVLARLARRDKVLDEVSAAILGDWRRRERLTESPEIRQGKTIAWELKLRRRIPG